MGDTITIGVQGNVAFPLLLATHALLTHLLAYTGKHSLKSLHPWIRNPWRIHNAEQCIELSIALGHELFIAKVQGVPLADVLLDSVT